MIKRNLTLHASRLLVAVACLMFSASCGSEMLRTGRSPVFLTITSLGGGAGSATAGSSPYRSDVLPVVNDVGIAVINVVPKDQSGALPLATGSVTTPLNNVTLTRYRVTFVRSDGRNTPGVDVPFGFDGGMSQTIPVNANRSITFDLVRHSSKSEPPLKNLGGFGGVVTISTIAEVTFFGHDQNGNEVTVTGSLDVTFADFADQ